MLAIVCFKIPRIVRSGNFSSTSRTAWLSRATSNSSVPTRLHSRKPGERLDELDMAKPPMRSGSLAKASRMGVGDGAGAGAVVVDVEEAEAEAEEAEAEEAAVVLVVLVEGPAAEDSGG